MIVKSLQRPSAEVLQLLANLVAVNTMDETIVRKDGTRSGNPTECALLQFVRDLGFDYEFIRNNTRGRSGVGALSEFLSEGKQMNFSSARKMMSWAVPLDNG